MVQTRAKDSTARVHIHVMCDVVEDKKVGNNITLHSFDVTVAARVRGEPLVGMYLDQNEQHKDEKVVYLYLGSTVDSRPIVRKTWKLLALPECLPLFFFVEANANHAVNYVFERMVG